MSLQPFERRQAMERPLDGGRPLEAAGAFDLRTATAADARAIHRLISEHVASDHLLPRTLDDIARRAARFVVVPCDGSVVGCAELAPLSPQVAEVRSMVVDAAARGLGAGRAMLDALVDRATVAGHSRLCAFTHRPAYFIRLGFSIVPHLWIREKVITDCVDCPLFRSCGQHAVELSLVERGRHRLREARVA